MKFGWINFVGAVIVLLMLVPNIIYAVKNKDEKNRCTNRFMHIIEQIGRYGCMVLMWMPLLIWKFGFKSVFEMVLYVIGNLLLLIAYYIGFAIYMKKKRTGLADNMGKKNVGLAMTLAIIPSFIFIFSGVLLRHWLLLGFAVVFAIGHIYVTWQNTRN